MAERKTITEIKLCECGCGNAAPIAKKTDRRLGHIKGQPTRFLTGHISRTPEFKKVMSSSSVIQKSRREGSDNGQWKGGRYVNSSGYVYVRVALNKYRFEHRVIAEKIIGRPLRNGEVVHHKNHNRSDNRPENLEVIPSHSEHMRQHLNSNEARRRGQKGIEARYNKRK